MKRLYNTLKSRINGEVVHPLAAAVLIPTGLAVSAWAFFDLGNAGEQSVAQTSTKDVGSLCDGLAFRDVSTAPRGVANIEIFPRISHNNNSVNAVYGKVLSGNDKGEPVRQAYEPDEGEFTMSYDPAATAVQVSKLAVSVLIPGHSELQACPDTTVTLNTTTGAVTPSVPTPEVSVL
ncbi:MAG TPA: hypothetical protein VGF75_00545 [Candidatus Saccharimonadales bacterium]|jgi:hypothetical protein